MGWLYGCLSECTGWMRQHNPWIVVPADNKWYRNYLVATTIVETLEQLKMKYPQ
jgi:polyphosphate kinase 2 (PPK2 family)